MEGKLSVSTCITMWILAKIGFPSGKHRYFAGFHIVVQLPHKKRRRSSRDRTIATKAREKQKKNRNTNRKRQNPPPHPQEGDSTRHHTTEHCQKERTRKGRKTAQKANNHTTQSHAKSPLGTNREKRERPQDHTWDAPDQPENQAGVENASPN